MDRWSMNYISCFLSYNFVCIVSVYIWTEVKLNSERKLNFDLLNIKHTCMSLSSVGATVSLVAEVTGLTGNRYTKWAQNSRQNCQV